MKPSQDNMMLAKAQVMQQSQKLKMDDTFEFECMGCGDCCYGHDDIILTGYDVWRIAHKLQIPMAHVINKYTMMHIGYDSKMPVATMSMRADGSCPLLSQGKCIVHEYKPVTCALFPIGRGIAADYNSDTRNVTYFYQDKGSHCKAIKSVHTLRDWLNKFNLIGSEKEAFAWFGALYKLTEIPTLKWYRDNYDTIDLKLGTTICQAVAALLYIKYDINKPYAEQLEANMSEFQELVGSVDAISKP